MCQVRILRRAGEADLARRLLAWYAIYMILWACPPNALSDPSAPVVCQRYDTIKQTILPHVRPYYDTYAEPHLAKIHPYLSKGQEYYEQFGAPTVAKGQDLWVNKASPRIKHGYSVVSEKYFAHVHPLLDRTVLRKSREGYSKYLDPHVQIVYRYCNESVYPHLHTLQGKALNLYTERIVPAYNATAPRVQFILATVENNYAKHVEPRVHAALKWIMRQINQVIIPRLKMLWAAHVQPQLDRIVDKLFRNREAKQMASKISEDELVAQRYNFGSLSECSETVDEVSDEPEETVESIEPDEDVSPTPEPIEDFDLLLEPDDQPVISAQPGPTIIKDERPALNRPVQVDALLTTWRTSIRNAGMKAEEEFIAAVHDIFRTEKERENVVIRNMLLELNNTIQTELISLRNTIMHLAKKGKATEKNDPRLQEFNDKLIASRKKIRNHAVEIRSAIPLPCLTQTLCQIDHRTLRSQSPRATRPRLENNGHNLRGSANGSRQHMDVARGHHLQRLATIPRATGHDRHD
jgi:hypothetical protein